jgi:RecA/RadA recombinase
MSDRLQQAITVLQTRFGNAAPRPAEPAAPARSSGFPQIDALTGIGGWPVGRLSLLAGVRGSGKRTLAQQSVAHATREGATVYIDFPGRLDPEFLHRLGADLNRLLIVRPRSIREAMESAGVLARAGADLVCLDLPITGDTRIEGELPHLLHRAVDAACTLLLIHEAQLDDPVRYYASLILKLERRDWVLTRAADLAGIEVEAMVTKNRLAAPGRRARLTLTYPDR